MLPTVQLPDTTTFVRVNTTHSDHQSHQDTLYKQTMPLQKLEERQMDETRALPTQQVQVALPLESGWTRLAPHQQSHSSQRKSGRRWMNRASIFAVVAVIVIASLL